MLALRILKHSFLQLIGNWRQALAISFLPMLLQVLAGAGALAFITTRKPQIDATQISTFGDMILPIIAFALIFALTTIWIAVNWHRYVLLHERQGLLPGFKGRPVWKYAISMLAIGLIIIPVLLAFGFVAGALLGMLQLGLAATVLINLIFAALLMTLVLRLSIGLPAAAIGAQQPITIAWRETIGATGTLLALALFMTALQLLFDRYLFSILIFNLGLGVIPTLVLQLVTYWFWMLLSLSILTTLYGYFVEKRELR
ncbi:hypothetical protein JJJ17_13485 [Paracoccus caeni]|uniref:Uncharacterized protein n=1 Tax=Paracoccus caeni TaxID=657651 RepID=A0A934W1M3_9RHOB|nr:hypothetical protein [Paracoccus caeni]MBK4216944.1 hypothetical protein [Paracoccus caeni]